MVNWTVDSIERQAIPAPYYQRVLLEASLYSITSILRCRITEIIDMAGDLREPTLW
jgi:hypothetical protein